MEFREIRLELSPADVATVTLNRPDTLNALNAAMLGEIVAAIQQAVEGGARCLLICGEGRGFSSGADLSAMDTRADLHSALAAILAPPGPAARR